jgi:hypothetical protein
MKKENMTKRKQKDKHRLIKEKICEALEGRKEKEDAIITLFFGTGEKREETKKKYKGMYERILKNLKKMDNKKLNDIAKGLIDLRTGAIF